MIEFLPEHHKPGAHPETKEPAPALASAPTCPDYRQLLWVEHQIPIAVGQIGPVGSVPCARCGMSIPLSTWLGTTAFAGPLWVRDAGKTPRTYFMVRTVVPKSRFIVSCYGFHPTSASN